MITRIKLQNWKSHLDSELSFSKSVNALIGIMGSGKSLPYDEIILVKKSGLWGKHKIGEIVEEQFKKFEHIKMGRDTFYVSKNKGNLYVQSMDPKTFKIKKCKITKFIKHKSPKTLLQIKTKSGRRITITKDHSLLVFKNGNIISLRGSDIRQGDFVPCAKNMDFGKGIEKMDISGIVPEFRDTTDILKSLELVKSGLSCGKVAREGNVTKGALEYWNKKEILPESEQIIAKHLKNAVPKVIGISNHFAKLTGAYISEGHSQYDEKKCRYSIKITNNDEKFIKELKSSWKNVFPSIPYNYIKNDLQMNGKVISAFFTRLFGPKSDNKYIPDLIYGFDDEKLANFLMMCFEGDGWIVPENNELAFSSKSLKLVDGLSTLLSRWGIISVVRERKIKGSSYYDMTVLPKHVPIFAKYSRFLTTCKQDKLKNLVKLVEKRSRWDGIDVIPNIKNLLHSLILEYQMSSRKNHQLRSLSKSFRVYMDYENMGREKLRKSLETIFHAFGYKTKSFKKLEKIVESDVFFDKIIEIKEIPSNSEYVYDLSVDKTENFVAGIGNIVAHNSSVMQAIAFALFGTFSGLSSRRISLDDLIMKKPQAKNMASVEIEFAVDGRKYVVKRTVEKGKGTKSAEIRDGEKLLEVNPQGVTREVQRILQMDYDLFQRAVYSEQNALDYFLQIPKGKRMQQIDSMLKLDRYGKARESAVSIRNKIFERRKERMRVIEDMKDRNLDRRISDLKTEIAGKEEEAELLEKKVLKVEEKRRKLSEKVVGYEADHDLFNEVSKRTEVTGSRVSEMKRQIKSKRMKLKGMKVSREMLGKLTKEIVNLEVKIEERENEVRILRERVSSKNSRILFLRNQIKDSKLRLSESKGNEMEMKKLEKLLGESPEKTLGKMLESLETAKKRLYSLEAKKDEVGRSLTELKEAGEKCPVCESRLTKARKSELMEHRVSHIGEIEVRVKEAEKRVSEMTKKAENFSEGIEKYKEINKDLRDIGSTREGIKENEEKIALLRKEVKKIVSEIQKREKEEKNLRKRLDGLNMKMGRTEDLLGDKEELENLMEEKRGLEKQIKGLRTQGRVLERKIRGMDIKSLRSELQEAVGISKVMETKLKDMGEILKDKVLMLRDLEEQKKTFLQYKEEVERYGRVIESMDVFVYVLRNTQDHLRDEFLKTVNYIMNEVWGELYPYGDFSEIRILVEKDYVLQLKGTKGWVNVDTVSGGERSLASLALRIAFSLAFTPNLRWLILDEPTHNLDANAIEHFGGVLRDRMENIIDQVFLITHEERLSDYVTGSIYKLERDKQIDGVTKIVAN